MSCIFFLHIFHIFHKEIWNIKWNENDFAGRCRWVRRIYWKKYKKIMKTEKKISLKTVYVLRLTCENLLFFYFKYIHFYLLFLFPNIYIKKNNNCGCDKKFKNEFKWCWCGAEPLRWFWHPFGFYREHSKTIYQTGEWMSKSIIC